MLGTYDPARKLSFVIAGVDVVARLAFATLRGEYLVRRTEVAIPGARTPGGPTATVLTGRVTRWWPTTSPPTSSTRASGTS